MDKRIPNTTMFEFMTRSMDIAQLERAKIPEAIMLSQSVGHLIKTVVNDSKEKNTGDATNYVLHATLKLHRLLETKTAFLLPYRYYFFIKNVLYGIPNEEDREHILKLPVRAFTSKEVGLRLYKLLAAHLSKYYPTASEMTYVTGKSIDTMWISEDLLQLDKHLIKVKLPDHCGECNGISDRVGARMDEIVFQQNSAGRRMPKGTVW